jgi:Domain of unknown function (DUF4340)
MVRRSTWILLIILALLIGFTWLFQRYQTNKTNNQPTATPTVALASIYNLIGKQVDTVNISNSNGEKIGFTRNAGSTLWSIDNMPSDQADSFQIESTLAQLFDITAQETISQTPPLDSIGLITPTYTISMTVSDGELIKTNVGYITPIGSGYYVRIDSGPVFIVDKVVLDDVLNFLTNPPLLATPTPELMTTETISPTESGNQVTPSP